MKQLDLGCGGNPHSFDGYDIFGVDIVDVGLANVKVADLAIESIPYDDNEFDLVTAIDFIEHIPSLLYINNQRRSSTIELFNEIYRVLKPGGKFHCMVPEFPLTGSVQDPTHVSFWNQESPKYFSGNYYGYGPHYGHKSNFQNLRVWKDSRYPIHFFFEFEAIKEV